MTIGTNTSTTKPNFQLKYNAMTIAADKVEIAWHKVDNRDPEA